jgi:hypothetical protein
MAFYTRSRLQPSHSSIANGFSRHELLRPMGIQKGSLGEQTLAKAAGTIGALSAEISLPKLRPRRA